MHFFLLWQLSWWFNSCLNFGIVEGHYKQKEQIQSTLAQILQVTGLHWINAHHSSKDYSVNYSFDDVGVHQ